ncbi:MAG: hypothetical protein WCJ49_08750 [Deltaproteobacteria bacterium]
MKSRKEIDWAYKLALHEDVNYNAPAHRLADDELEDMARGIAHTNLVAGLDEYSALRRLEHLQGSFWNSVDHEYHPRNLSHGEYVDLIYGSLNHPFEQDKHAKELTHNPSPDDSEILQDLGIHLEEPMMKRIENKETTMKNSLLDKALNETLYGGPRSLVGQDGGANMPGGPGTNMNRYLGYELATGSNSFAMQAPGSMFEPLNQIALGQSDSPKMGVISNQHGTPTNMFEMLDNAHKIALGVSVIDENLKDRSPEELDAVRSRLSKRTGDLVTQARKIDRTQVSNILTRAENDRATRLGGVEAAIDVTQREHDAKEAELDPLVWHHPTSGTLAGAIGDRKVFDVMRKMDNERKSLTTAAATTGRENFTFKS